MARKYETKSVTKSVEMLVETTCDFCGRVAKQGYWESSCYDASDVQIEVTVKQEEGRNYPDSGYGTKYVIDMCPACFKNKLVPWARENGAKVDEIEWDW